MPSISFVIPCFNSDTSLLDVVKEIQIGGAAASYSVEVILVLDSREIRHTGLLNHEILKASNVRVVELSRNYGQHNAIVIGVTRATGDFIVTLDDDGQHSPSDAFAIVQMMVSDEKKDLVYAVPKARHQSQLRYIFGRGVRAILRLAGLRHASIISPFRVFRGDFRDAFEGLAGPKISVDIVLAWVANSISSHSVDFRERATGASGYSAGKLLRLALTYLVAQSTAPLRASLVLGFLGFVVSVAAGIMVLSQYLVGKILEPGFTSIVLLVSLFSSLQLLLLGILGEYVGEQHRRGMSYPLAYVLRDSSPEGPPND